MNDEVRVVVVFLLTANGGGYNVKQFEDVYVNVRVPIRRLLPQLLTEFSKEINIDWSPDDLEILVQMPDGSSLSNGTIREDCKILIMPKYDTKNLVRRGR